MQDKAALEVKCRDLQAQLENVQGQRSEHRQALKVRWIWLACASCP